MQIINERKKETIKGIEQTNQEHIRMLEKKCCEYLGILEADTNKQSEIMEKIDKVTS